MPPLYSISHRCAVCGARATDLSQWFTGDISGDRIALRQAGESQEPGSSEVHFCSEDHAGQFLVAWLLCEGECNGNQAGPITVLPRSDEFRLTRADAAVELSLSMAIQKFWEEGIRGLEDGILRRCVRF